MAVAVEVTGTNSTEAILAVLLPVIVVVVVVRKGEDGITTCCWCCTGEYLASPANPTLGLSSKKSSSSNNLLVSLPYDPVPLAPLSLFPPPPKPFLNPPPIADNDLDGTSPHFFSSLSLSLTSLALLPLRDRYAHNTPKPTKKSVTAAAESPAMSDVVPALDGAREGEKRAVGMAVV